MSSLSPSASDQEIQDYIVELLQEALKDPLVKELIKTATDQNDLFVAAIAANNKDEIHGEDDRVIRSMLGYEWVVAQNADADPFFGGMTPTLKTYVEGQLSRGNLPILVWLNTGDENPGGQALSFVKAQLVSELASDAPTIDVTSKEMN